MFPSAVSGTSAPSYEFLSDDADPHPLFQAILQSASSTNTPPPPALPPTAPAIRQNASQNVGHSMQTRSKTGNLKPKTQISLLTSVSPIPKSHTNWTLAMRDEYDAFCVTRTGILFQDLLILTL